MRACAERIARRPGRSCGRLPRMPSALTLDQAVDLTRSGDIWLFRGRRAPDRAIRAVTNSPVNHVGMAVVVDDLPPLIFHAELGRKQVDMWTGGHHRGVQLHDLREAVARWQGEYRQDAWLRQLQPEIGRKLKQYYDDLVSDEIPDRFAALLSQLEKAEPARKKD